ncbi:MAG: hypothetical protein J6M01_03165 [Prevotella sp.]|nr:hypothetical protein [Prevotella sp.]
MAYQSIDELQTLLSQEVFGDRQDSKKAAGRALGTFIETIVFYLLRQWGENDSVAIERPLAEYGHEEITHNVEFTLHPVRHVYPSIEIPANIPTTARQIAKRIELADTFVLTGQKVINKGVIQNACVIGSDEKSMVIAAPDRVSTNSTTLHTYILDKHAYAMIECKRVGKEGDAKGPQTIEKAKQGAYVAKTTSSLQKVRNDQGGLDGVYYVNGEAYVGPYNQLLREIIFNGQPQQLRDFTLSIGVVSNHGNWFTAGNQNKEMKVLAQSYDWLLFLTDEGLVEFIVDLIRSPLPKYKAVRDAFIASYPPSGGPKIDNSFTKKKMEQEAHFALDAYFAANFDRIEKWFNVISPGGGTLQDLRQILMTLKEKDWEAIL